jgi:hypothetical protein
MHIKPILVRESKIQSAILRDLESYQPFITVFKIEKANKDGVCDVFFSSKLTGAVFVECKRPGETPSKNQIGMIESLNSTGCKAFSCDSIPAWIKLKKQLGISEESLKIAHKS